MATYFLKSPESRLKYCKKALEDSRKYNWDTTVEKKFNYYK